MMWFDGWGGWAVGMLMMVLVWGAAIAILVFVLRGVMDRDGGTRPSSLPRRSAIDVLEDRFARGEISAEEFEERRRILEASSASR